jgi:hypothetical protein
MGTGSLCLAFHLSLPEVPKLLQGKRAKPPVLPATRLVLPTAPTTEEGHADGAPELAAVVEHTETVEETAPPASAAAEAAPVPEVEPAPAHSEVVAAAAATEEDTAADTSEAAHAAELEAALLAASSPGDEAPAEPATDAAATSVETLDAAAAPSEAPDAAATPSEASVVTEGAEV